MKSEIKQSALIGIERAVVCTVGYSVWNESDRYSARIICSLTVRH